MPGYHHHKSGIFTNNMSPWNKIELYGGAITTVIPQGFMDVSMLREVPDTQEVYVNSRDPNGRNGDDSTISDGLGFNESVIVDLLQRVEESDDKKALDFHLKEIADLNGSTQWEILQYDDQFPSLLVDSCVAQTCVTLETAYKWGKANEKQTVISCVGLLRLVDVETDVLITVNVPLDTQRYPEETWDRLSQCIQDKSLLPDRISVAYNLLKEIVKNFNIKDKSLFA